MYGSDSYVGDLVNAYVKLFNENNVIDLSVLLLHQTNRSAVLLINWSEGLILAHDQAWQPILQVWKMYTILKLTMTLQSIIENQNTDFRIVQPSSVMGLLKLLLLLHMHKHPPLCLINFYSDFLVDVNVLCTDFFTPKIRVLVQTVSALRFLSSL